MLSQRLTLIWLAHLRPSPHNSGLKNNQLVSTRWNIALKKIWVFRYHIYTPSGNYMFKVNNKNTKTRCEILLKLTIKTPEQRQWSNTLKKFVGKLPTNCFECFWPMVSFWCLYYYLWTHFTPCSSIFIANFEQVNASWDHTEQIII